MLNLLGSYLNWHFPILLKRMYHPARYDLGIRLLSAQQPSFHLLIRKRRRKEVAWFILLSMWFLVSSCNSKTTAKDCSKSQEPGVPSVFNEQKVWPFLLLVSPTALWRLLGSGCSAWDLLGRGDGAERPPLLWHRAHASRGSPPPPSSRLCAAGWGPCPGVCAFWPSCSVSVPGTHSGYSNLGQFFFF